jgi:TonB family protein
MFNYSAPISSEPIYSIPLETIVVSVGNIEKSVESDFSYWEIISIIYLTGLSIFLIRFIIQLLQIYSLIRKNGINKIDGYKIVFSDGKFSPFSFFNIIFLDNSFEYNSRTSQILVHEKIHIDKLHTLDILLFELITIVQWFNPIIWYYKSALKDLHEFQADEGVIAMGFDKINYQKLILEQISGAGLFKMAHNFNYQSIKRRFTMLTKSRTRKLAILKLLMLIPLSLLLAISFACTENEEVSFLWDDIHDSSSNKIARDSFPDFPGGWKAEANYFANNIQTPDEFIKRGIPGKVTIRFDVMKDGSIQNARVAQSVDMGKEWKKGELGYGCDEIALKAIRNMPKWKPAYYNGKAVDMTTMQIFLFGNEKMKQVWNEFYRNQPNWIESRSLGSSMPEFPGGDGKMIEFLANNLKYPELSRKAGTQGTVEVDFTVEPDGKITNIEITKSISKELDAEAMRVVSSMPKWVNETGKKAVMKVPVRFKLPDEKSVSVPLTKENVRLDPIDEVPSMNVQEFIKNFKYPETARKQGIQGTVLLKVLVDTDGKTSTIEVVSSDNEILNESAIGTMKNTTFTPGKNKGKNVSAWVNVPVKFKLQDKEK